MTIFCLTSTVLTLGVQTILYFLYLRWCRVISRERYGCTDFLSYAFIWLIKSRKRVCVCKIPAPAHCIHKPLSLCIVCNGETKCMCSAYRQYVTFMNTHTHTVNTNCSRLCVWFMRSGPVLADEWRPKGFVATRTHGNSPSTLSPTTIQHICLSVQPWLGKSLTQRPSGLLKATDQTKIENKRKKY